MQTGVSLLAVITSLVGLFYVLYGIALCYHWIRYSESWAIAAFSIGSYVVGGAYLLSLMTAAIFML
jgi:hypothetical protein